MHKHDDTCSGYPPNMRTFKMTPEMRIKVDIYSEFKTQEKPPAASPTEEGKDIKETRMLSDG